MAENFEAGIENCVATCARVERGQSVYIVTQEEAADPAVVEALTESARDRGGDVHVVNGPVIPKERPEEIPAAVLDAYGRADVLFAHYPSLKREELHHHFPGEARVRVPNRARTVALMSSDWAAFPTRCNGPWPTPLTRCRRRASHGASPAPTARTCGEPSARARARWRKPTS